MKTCCGTLKLFRAACIHFIGLQYIPPAHLPLRDEESSTPLLSENLLSLAEASHIDPQPVLDSCREKP